MPLIVPESYLIYREIGLDPGLNHTGVAIFDIDFRTLNILSINAFTMSTDHMSDNTGLDDEYHPERAIKLLKLQQASSNIFQYYVPSEVGCEAPFYNRFRPMAYAALVEVVNAIYLGLINWNPNVVFTTIPPMSVKKTLGAKAAKNDSNAGKQLVKDAIRNIPEITNALSVDLERLSEHAIDAIGVAYALLQLRRNQYAQQTLG